MIPSLFNKLNITRLGAATATPTPNPGQDSALGGNSVDTSSLSQGLSQLDLNEYAESSEDDDEEDRAIVSDCDETQESFEDIVYEDSDEFSNWSIPSSVPITPMLSSPTHSLPAPSTQEDVDLLLSPVQYQQEQQDVEPDHELGYQQEEQRVEQLGHQEEEQGEPQRERLKQRLHQQLPSQPKELHKEQEHQLQLHHNQQQYYELRLPLDVWIEICSYLYPSQLARLSVVNRAAYDLVASLDIWEACHKRLHGKAHSKIVYSDNSDNRQAMHTMQLLPNMPKSHCYMLFMCAISRQVCEKCLRRCDGRLHRGRLASMPLPVIMPSVDQHASLSHKGSINHELESLEEDVESMGPEDDEDDDEEEIWTIRMCKNCRILHYQSHPEPIPQEITTSFLTKRAIREKYRLGHKEVQAITIRSTGDRQCGMPVTYSEAAGLMQSRRVYGGDVGRLAVPRSLSKFMRMLNNRVYIYDRRRRVLEAGGRWLPLEEFKALKAAGLSVSPP